MTSGLGHRSDLPASVYQDLLTIPECGDIERKLNIKPSVNFGPVFAHSICLVPPASSVPHTCPSSPTFPNAHTLLPCHCLLLRKVLILGTCFPFQAQQNLRDESTQCPQVCCPWFFISCSPGWVRHPFPGAYTHGTRCALALPRTF